MNSPLISIIIPVFNAEDYLETTLNSVINQSYFNIEIICINDGSTDNSLKILQKYAQIDKRIKILTINNVGQAKASNVGLKHSTGDYIKYVDADDILSLNHLEFQYNALKNYPDYIASCEWGRFYGNDYKEAKFIPETVWEDLSSKEWLLRALRQKSDMMGAWLWLIPRKIIEKTGGFNENLSLNNDFEFSVRLLIASRGVKFAKGAKLYYRSGLPGSLSQTLSETAVQSAFLTTYLACDNLLKYIPGDEIKQLCANRYQTWIYRIYPQYPELLIKFQDKIKQLGGSNNKIEGGKLFLFISSILGWRTAKRLQIFYQKIKHP